MTTGNWGLEQWGVDLWGGGLGAGGTLQLVDAFIDSERTMQVGFNTPPLAQSTIGQGDALNPASWKIYNAQTGQIYTVMAVNQLDAVTFQPFTLQKLADWKTLITVDAGLIVDTNHVPIISPATAAMGGCKAYTPAAQPQGMVDLHNVPVAGTDAFEGTIKTNSSGDYALQGGIDLLKKLIYRRLTTIPGAFFYLPNYGLGLSAKGLVGPSRMATLKTQIEKQVALEPEVASCKAQLALDLTHNILTIALQVTLAKSNQQIPLSIPVKVS